MTTLIPNFIADKNCSYGEKRIFALFKSLEIQSEYYVFHSLNIPDHITKREGEADFVLVGTKGLFVIEIKGAKKIKVKDGIWKYYTGDKSYNSYETPFHQAQKNLYSLINSISKNLKIELELKQISGYGVIFPNLVFDIKSEEWSKEIILDENNLDRFDDYINNLFDYWRSKSRISDNMTLSKETILKIRNYLRPNFEKLESVKSFIFRQNKLIEEVTSEQFFVLDGLSNNQRILINGLAGTGKTFLAIEQAKRKGSETNKVLFLCFNRLLMQTLYTQLKNDKYIDVYNIDKLLFEILLKNNLKHKLSNINELADIIYDHQSIIEFPEYDYLVIDEGQDILNQKYYQIINRLLKFGIDEGSWAIFYDDVVQEEMYGDSAQLKKILSELSKNAANYYLSINCRNTKYLGQKTHTYTKLPIPPQYRLDGGAQGFNLFFTKEDRTSSIVKDILLKLFIEGTKPSYITILSPKRDFDFLKEIFSEVRKYIDTFIDISNYSTDIKEERGLFVNEKCVTYSTIHSFKGMENEIIILTGVSEEVLSKYPALLYVGMTRAKSGLYVIAEQNLSNIIN